MRLWSMTPPTPNTPTPRRWPPRTPPTPAGGSRRRRGPTAVTPTCPLRRSHPTPPPHPSAGSDPAVHRWRGVDRRTTAPNPQPTRHLPGPARWRRYPATARWRYRPAGSSPPQVRSPPTCAGNSPWRPSPNSTPATPTTDRPVYMGQLVADACVEQDDRSRGWAPGCGWHG